MRIGGGGGVGPSNWPPPDWLDSWKKSDPTSGGTKGDSNRESGTSGSGAGGGDPGNSSERETNQGGDISGGRGYSQEDTFERVKDSGPNGIDSGPNGGGSLQLPDSKANCSSDPVNLNSQDGLVTNTTDNTAPRGDAGSLELWDGFNIDPNIAYAEALPFEALTLDVGVDSAGYQANQDTNSPALDYLSPQAGDQQYSGNVDLGQQDCSHQSDDSYLQSYQDSSYQQSYQDNSYQQSYQDNSYQQSYTQGYSYQPDYSYQQSNW